MPVTKKLFISLAVIAVLLPQTLLAAADWSWAFCQAASIIDKGAGTAIATIAVISVSIFALLGRVSWGVAVLVAAGIGGLFAAAQIAEAVAGFSMECNNASPYVPGYSDNSGPPIGYNPGGTP